jgi:hypothetical protein
MIVPVLVMLLAVAFPPIPKASPPIIVTTKTSVLCNAVRTILAPAVLGLIDQDFMIDRGRDIVHDMAKMHDAGAEAWVEMDTMRLSDVVDGVAQNNIKVHRLLGKLAEVSLKDPLEQSELASLRSRLLTIADEQAESLNLLSGTAQTEELNEFEGAENPMAAALEPDIVQNHAAGVNEAREEAARPAPPDPSNGLSQTQNATANEESPIVALVRPIVERCR